MQERGLLVRRARWVLCLAGLCAFAGCASAPSIPEGLSPLHTEVQDLGAPPQVLLEEEGWTSPAAQKGGLTGLGIGLGVGGLACAATGPLAPLCFASVVPLTTAVGAVGGAVVGKVVAAGGDAAADKATLLKREWSLLVQRMPLDAALKGQLHARVPLSRDEAAVAPKTDWRLRVGYATLGTIGSGSGQPFALQGTARLQVWQAGRNTPEVDRLYSATSASRLTLEQWRADDDKALRQAMDDIGNSLAAQMAVSVVGTARRMP